MTERDRETKRDGDRETEKGGGGGEAGREAGRKRPTHLHLSEAADWLEERRRLLVAVAQPAAGAHAAAPQRAVPQHHQRVQLRRGNRRRRRRQLPDARGALHVQPRAALAELVIRADPPRIAQTAAAATAAAASTIATTIAVFLEAGCDRIQGSAAISVLDFETGTGAKQELDDQQMPSFQCKVKGCLPASLILQISLRTRLKESVNKMSG